MPKCPLLGSEWQPLRGARAAGRADPADRCQVTVVLHHSDAEGLRAAVGAVISKQQAHLGRADFAGRFAADATDITLVKQFAAKHRLRVLRVEPDRRTVVLRGSVEACNAAFDVDLQHF